MSLTSRILLAVCVFGVGSPATAQTTTDESQWASRIAYGWVIPQKTPIGSVNPVRTIVDDGRSLSLEISKVVAAELDLQMLVGIMSVPLRFQQGAATPVPSDGLHLSTFQIAGAFHPFGRRQVDVYAGPVIGGFESDSATAELPPPAGLTTLRVAGTWGAGVQVGARLPGCICKGTFAVDINARFLRWRTPLDFDQRLRMNPWNVTIGVIYMH